eukprot:TRINITY_DN3116_c0_g1_i1.p1 TRINITY_DN3116_c0_g1~~TRINITY_DN3116_c0_g1_i1.p1  ORF type:complete len:393 (+),score=66.16 TRINITY_DN3116_c0_g1_i1:235-1413(+)
MMSTWPDMKMGGKPLGPPISSSNCFPGRYSPTYRVPEHQMRRCVTNPPGGTDVKCQNFIWGEGLGKISPQQWTRHDVDIFNGLNNDLLAREGLVAIDMKHSVSPGPVSVTQVGSPLSHTSIRESMNVTPGPITHIKQDMMYPSSMGSPAPPNSRQMDSHEMSLDMLGSAVVSSGMSVLPSSMSDCVTSPHSIHPSMSMYNTHSGMMSPHAPLTHHHHPHHPHGAPMPMSDADTDPRELEAFAERFKQRRIKLGVTQCDVGKALANLKLPGVGALSQSTICRFESLTLSHNNMIALKPVLLAWLEEAEAARRDPDGHNGLLPNGEKKRKRTSIAAPEKRSLEAYFAVQPRPSGEKIAAIAEKLDLKKNVVRVWFCNQRQKQKRMKFAAQGSMH